MATGALMYVIPYFRLSGLEIIECIILGLLFSTVLIWTSRFETDGHQIYMKRSKAFPIILITLLLIRTIIKVFVSSQIDQVKLQVCFLTCLLYDCAMETSNAI